VNPVPGHFELVIESIKFFAWIFGSIISLAMLLLGLYLKIYIKDPLEAHSAMLQAHFTVMQAVLAQPYRLRNPADE